MKEPPGLVMAAFHQQSCPLGGSMAHGGAVAGGMGAFWTGNPIRQGVGYYGFRFDELFGL